VEFYDRPIARLRYFDEEEIAYAGENNSGRPIPAIEISKSISKGFSRISLSVIRLGSVPASASLSRELCERRNVKRKDPF